jgi:hypothetical protein
VSSSFALDIAGLTVAVTGDADLDVAPEGSARKFVLAASDAGQRRDAGARVDIHASWGDPRVPDGAATTFDSGKGLWRLYRAADGPSFVFTSPALGALPYQAATFSDDFRRGQVTLRRTSFARHTTIYPLHYPLDEVFMVHLLARGLGVELHGGGVVTRDGRGYLFVGQSGAGKSTLSKLWLGEPDVTLLSDERIIVRQEAGELWMYGTPWHGDGYIANQGRAKLERVYFLRHGPRNQARALPAATAVARLFACGFTPFHDAEGLDYSLGLLTEVARHCRCEELSFVPDRSAVEFVMAT